MVRQERLVAQEALLALHPQSVPVAEEVVHRVASVRRMSAMPTERLRPIGAMESAISECRRIFCRYKAE